MNERIIWDLVSKARELAVSDTPDGGKCFDQDVFHNKFAELIVKECVSVVENLSPGYDDYRNQIEDAFRGDCVGQLKQHFGVEE